MLHIRRHDFDFTTPHRHICLSNDGFDHRYGPSLIAMYHIVSMYLTSICTS